MRRAPSSGDEAGLSLGRAAAVTVAEAGGMDGQGRTSIRASDGVIWGTGHLGLDVEVGEWLNLGLWWNEVRVGR